MTDLQQNIIDYVKNHSDIDENSLINGLAALFKISEEEARRNVEQLIANASITRYYDPYCYFYTIPSKEYTFKHRAANRWSVSENKIGEVDAFISRVITFCKYDQEPFLFNALNNYLTRDGRKKRFVNIFKETFEHGILKDKININDVGTLLKDCLRFYVIDSKMIVSYESFKPFEQCNKCVEYFCKTMKLIPYSSVEFEGFVDRAEEFVKLLITQALQEQQKEDEDANAFLANISQTKHNFD